ncbi:amino acid efflux transporter [Actinopolyspora lacussalsi subsp. righensis]|uniref:Amino acid efflux transporter n=1 Tax=Actinopolyspora righensis TaxID=995060 RepID=A0A1I6XGP8_9ACTN|nr:APC family permease [Actinopolyspora righensis]SFT37182.1 amino acid efflux transporter [Actinopolyspora righensis]
MDKLQKTMGGTVGTFVALSTILGSGMMILPGTSYNQLGKSAWIPWAAAAVSVVPLLYCYAWLGRRYPSASGVAYYSEVALGGTTGRTSGLLATFALTTGIPATAITGGRYVAEFSGISALAWVFPIMVLVGATVAASAGANVSGKLQVGLILGLFVMVACTAVIVLSVHGIEPPNSSMELLSLSSFGSVLTAVYVAFTGWETVSFTFEEHKRSDLIPRIFVSSYVIVVVLYSLLLLSLFAAADSTDSTLNSAPLLIIAERSLGDLARPATLLLVIACISANVFASVLALSRLVFGLSRSGYLPALLSKVRDRDLNPVTSVVVVGSILAIIALLGSSGLFRFELLFVLSGGIYFVLYGVGAASFAKLARGSMARVVSLMCAVTVLLVTILAGPSMWFPWVLFFLVWIGISVLNRWTSNIEKKDVRV